MTDASASKNHKGIPTKKDKEDMMPKTTFFSKLKRVGDTNIGTVDMVPLRDRLKESHSPMVKKINKSGIVQASAFPPTLPCLDLVMECASQFDIVTKSIFNEGQSVLTNISGTNDYKTFYDAFSMKIVTVLQGTPARRLSPEAKTKVKKYGSWFIPFLQFTYIRVVRCTTCPKRLPRYPPDRIVLMDLARKLEQCEKMMKLKGEERVTFSLMIGNDSFPNPVAFATTEKELEHYHLGWYRERQGFNPNGLIKASHRDPFKHIATIEDFLVNAQDNFHVRKLAFSRLSMGMMRAIKWRGLDIPDQLEDDEDVLREDYSTVEGTELTLVDWDDHQDPSLEVVTSAVDLHIEWWYNKKLR